MKKHKLTTRQRGVLEVLARRGAIDLGSVLWDGSVCKLCKRQ